MICKLKARLNLHGILNVESGYYVEDVEIEEPVPEEKESEKKDADALKKVRDGLAELKKAWPTAMAPKTPVKDYATVLADVSRIELAIGKLM